MKKFKFSLSSLFKKNPFAGPWQRIGTFYTKLGKKKNLSSDGNIRKEFPELPDISGEFTPPPHWKSILRNQWQLIQGTSKRWCGQALNWGKEKWQQYRKEGSRTHSFTNWHDLFDTIAEKVFSPNSRPLIHRFFIITLLATSSY
ncbi:MAG: hypothetical protein WCG27_02100, partial [Pseudomonadota bacterium]